MKKYYLPITMIITMLAAVAFPQSGASTLFQILMWIVVVLLFGVSAIIALLLAAHRFDLDGDDDQSGMKLSEAILRFQSSLDADKPSKLFRWSLRGAMVCGMAYLSMPTTAVFFILSTLFSMAVHSGVKKFAEKHTAGKPSEQAGV